MSPTKPVSSGILTGQALADLSAPLAATPRGGYESGFDGTEGFAPEPEQAPADANPFAGMGSWLEDDDKAVFKTADNLVLRQELPAQNHLAQDSYYKWVKLGYPFATLERDPIRDSFRCVLPTGTNAMSIQAVPNKAWDLVNKATETVLVDPAQPDPTPLNDSEDAHAAAEMAEKFLTEDAGENGTNDLELFFNGVDRSLTCATSYLEAFVDPVGGGYVPLQILAHPQAVSPDNPLIGPDVTDPMTGVVTPGMPTPNNILRYVTAPSGGQFTTNPSEAAPQWQPKIRGAIWGREHWRVFPESATVNNAEKVIGLLYTTIGEAKRRWPAMRKMEQAQIDALLNWMPMRALVLLPPFQRARYKISSGGDKEKSGSSDERILFYYRVLQKAAPDHPKGAEIIVSGASGGIVLDRKLLAATVSVPSEDGTGPKEETRCMDIPLVQITPRADPDERDPTGRCYMELFAGATEFNAALAASFLEAVNQWLHPESYLSSTSIVQDFQITESRATGVPIPITRPEDVVKYGNQAPMPTNFWQSVDWNDKQIDSIASMNKPVTGQDGQEVSGKARQIAVQQAMVGLSRMQHPINAAKARWCRLKLQLAMRDYTTPQIIRYEGEDGAYKAVEWKGTDFALVGEVAIKAGSGTMMPPEAKVQYIGNLQAAGLLTPEEAADAARPSFAPRLGITESPHAQYIERCVSLWLDGPPPGWLELYSTFQQQTAAYQQQVAPMQYAAQRQAAVEGAEGRPAPPAPPLPPAPVAPWSPFQPKPNDSEPLLAALWVKKLSAVMSTVKYDQQPAQWRAPFDQKYSEARNAVAASAAPAPLPKGVSIGVKTDPSNVAEAENAATHPSAAKPQGAAA